MKKMILIGIVFVRLTASAQQDSSHSLTISGYVETYYSFDFDHPSNHQKPGFLYSYNRHNEVNINLAFLKANFQKENIRANLAIGAGTYMNANLSSEPGVLKNIFEANAGVRLSRKKSIWLDAGIFPSHVGFESAIGKDCWTVTRSLLAENSPYYEAGAKLTYSSDDDRWLFSVLVLNGWQRIQRVEGNNTLAFGHQLSFKPNSKLMLNSSSFVGNDKPDSARQWRYFHNFYGTFQLSRWADLVLGFDWGIEQKSFKSNSYNQWYSPVAILRTSLGDKSKMAFRAEYYHDPSNVIVSVNNNGFQTKSFSVNYDYQVSKLLTGRIEGRGFYSKERIFADNRKKNNYSITLALAFAF